MVGNKQMGLSKTLIDVVVDDSNPDEIKIVITLAGRSEAVLYTASFFPIRDDNQKFTKKQGKDSKLKEKVKFIQDNYFNNLLFNDEPAHGLTKSMPPPTG